jgi:hypothetical protein
VAEPLASAGGVVAEELESDGGAADVESAGGEAGAVAVESAGAVLLGDVDSCFEQATNANVLRHTKRRLRFIEMTSLYVGDRPPRLLCSAGWNTTLTSQSVFLRLIHLAATSCGGDRVLLRRQKAWFLPAA